MENNESYEQKIKSLYNTLSSSEKKVADFVLSNGYAISTMSLNKLSTEIGVSEPTIIRFVKKIGCTGYSEFKMNLMKDWGRKSVSEKSEPNLLVDLHINKDEKLEDIPQKMIGITIKALEDTLKLIDFEKYRKAIELICNANIIDVYGVGNSGSIASDIMNKLIRIGLNCRSYPDNHVQQIYASHLTDKDVAIAISHSGNTIDTVNVLKIAKEAGAKTIALTNFRASAISDYADIVFYTGDVETTFYSETMVSRISQLAIVDMLYMGILLENFESSTKKLEKINMLVKEKNYQ
ncbi:MurR/RpiR family transcriptional regulator [Clostridium sp. LIBA-8841]|uniref:MurR/RpiR family transcriptional regulator n=1 Tax=Clostridium sp. LIBA-8841 TaxID=2987530 RepID=UPI002AC62D79|nr:MurR/RpiR family transcriptional regulator [Clostridium sp. LIBA-8841]MDZ5253679.1 MurR/RpiR family transcriptional regulator [Clostridium sp. LIBA-8841]